MAPGKALAQLALQKRLLQAESEAQRLVLAAEIAHLTRPWGWFGRIRSRAHPLLVILTPVTAFLFARRSRGMTRWVTAGLGLARVYGSLRGVFRRHPAK